MLRVGVDVGGTFTDIVVYDPSSGRLSWGKVLSRPRDPVRGVVDAFSSEGIGPDRVGVVVHATTLATNALLGQVGLELPDAALITNRGFEDVLEIGRQARPSLYDPFYMRPPPLVPRRRRHGVAGRLDASGVEVEPLDVAGVERVAREECRRGVRVFIVAFLHSYRNPVHEAEAARAVERACPGAVVIASSSVDPQPMEYERVSTAVVNALLKPIISGYLERLGSELRGRGFRGVLLVMKGDGGVASPREAAERPASLIESGPAAGAVAAAYYSGLAGLGDVLAFDMGGTTAKASTITGGRPDVVGEIEVGAGLHAGRRPRGAGYPVRFPHVDLVEVSAGGGSIAWVDAGGGLRVGPRSAGADPGPACYGRGGVEPTVTDAHLVLGRLPESIAGGRLRLRRELAVEALREHVARPLGVDVYEAAWAVVSVANTLMGRALRMVTVERGRDPRGYTLLAFGGAGPLHAAELAGEVGVGGVAVPPMPGVFSALGLLAADYRHELRAPVNAPLDSLDPERVEGEYTRLAGEAAGILESEGVPRGRVVLSRLVEARYWGQASVLRIPYPGSLDALRDAFHEAHEARYGFRVPGERVEVVSLIVEAVGVTEKPRLERRRGKGEAEPVGEREVFAGGGWVEAAVYRLEALPPGAYITGPAVVEGVDSTVLVPSGWSAVVDEYGGLRLSGV